MHLALAAYVYPLPTRAGRTTQWTGSSLLSLSSPLLIAAFVIEPIAGNPRTPASTFGLYSLFAGALLHFAITLRRPGARG